MPKECIFNLCDGTGYTKMNRPENRPLKPGEKIPPHEESVLVCKCVEFYRVQQKLSWCSIPEQYAKGGFESFDRSLQPQAFDTAKQWVNEEEDWLYMFGDYGTGKTHLATAAIREHHKKGIAGVIISVPSMLDILRPRKDGDTQQFKQILSVPVLGLDDFGAQRNTEWVTEQIFKILDYRSMRKKKTILTANYDLDQLASIDAGWPRIVDRIAENAVCREMKPGTYRIKKGKQIADKYKA